MPGINRLSGVLEAYQSGQYRPRGPGPGFPFIAPQQPPAATVAPPVVPPTVVPPPANLPAPSVSPMSNGSWTGYPGVMPTNFFFPSSSPAAPFSNPMSPSFGAGSIPPYPTSSQVSSGQLGQLGTAACGFITNPTARAVCIAAAGLLPGGGGGGQQNSSSANSGGCPVGYVPDGQGGCRIQGIGGYLPGDVGRQDFGWQAVNGRFGAGYVPIEIPRSIARCPAGAVLGKDGICYDHLPRGARLHNPGARPFLTGGDMRALARARQLQKTIGKLNTRFGPKKPRFLKPKKAR
jgi:hypothetical protein